MTISLSVILVLVSIAELIVSLYILGAACRINDWLSSESSQIDWMLRIEHRKLMNHLDAKNSHRGSTQCPADSQTTSSEDQP